MAQALSLLVVLMALPVIVQADTPNFSDRYAGEDVEVELPAAGRTPDQDL
jgi:hypothetical protein